MGVFTIFKVYQMHSHVSITFEIHILDYHTQVKSLKKLHVQAHMYTYITFFPLYFPECYWVEVAG